MNKQNNNVLILFVKAPRLGQVKTRLQPQLTPEQSLWLYRAMVEDSVRQFEAVGFCDLKIFFTPADSLGEIKDWLGQQVEYFPQQGNDLGGKMHHALTACLHQGYKKAVLVGSDIPTLDVDTVHKAFSCLSECDVVIGLTDDGGYYLIGMKSGNPRLFENIHWSTDQVLQQTLQQARRMELKIKQLKVLFDIDTYRDVEKLWSIVQRLPANRFEETIPVKTRTTLEQFFQVKQNLYMNEDNMDKSKLGWEKGWIRILVLAGLAAVIFLIFRFTPLSLADFTPTNVKNFILSFGIWSPIVFIAIYALRGAVLVIPVGIMSFAGGLAFGKWFGTIYILIGATLGASLSFLIARYFGRQFIESFGWLHKGKIKQFDEGVKKNGFRMMLFMRLIPLFQYDAVNFGSGLSKMKFRDFFIGSFIGMAPGGFINAMLGSSLENIISFQFFAALAFFILLMFIPTIYKKIKKNKSADAAIKSA